MSDEFFLYLLTRMESIRFAAGMALVVSGALGVFLSVVTMVMASDTPKNLYEEEVGPYFKRLKQAFYVAATAIVLLVAIPSRNDMVIIFGGGALMDVARSGEAREIGGKTLAVIEQWLDENAKEKSDDK